MAAMCIQHTVARPSSLFNRRGAKDWISVSATWQGGPMAWENSLWNAEGEWPFGRKFSRLNMLALSSHWPVYVLFYVQS
jgi:hypothetical protein